MPPGALTHGPGESHGRAFYSALVTLTLAILGSSVLPVPYAFSRTGVLLGVITAALVSLANSLTAVLLIRTAGAFGKTTYESLAETIGGPRCRRLTQTWLIILLYGTLCGDFALIADTGRLSALKLLGSAAPTWLISGDGRAIMILLSVFVVFPLACLRHIRKLEQVALAGFVLVLWLTLVIVSQCIREDFPAIRSGDLPLLDVKLTADLPEAVGVLSFAFYVHPMLLPLLAEMPHGPAGRRLTERATGIVTSGVAFVIYVVIGVFGAARYGSRTEGDCLVNEWMGGAWDGALDAAMVLYLALCILPIVLTLRLQIDTLLLGPNAARAGTRHRVVVVGAVILASLAVALCFPTAAEKMYAITGASAVCVVCYVLPVVFHLLLFYRRPDASRWGGGSGPGGTATVTAPLLDAEGSPVSTVGGGSSLPSLAGWARRDSSAGDLSRAGSLLDVPAAVLERMSSCDEADDAKLARGISDEAELERLAKDAMNDYPCAARIRANPVMRERVAGWFTQLVLPVAVLVIGVATSLLGLGLAIMDLLK